MFDVPPAEKCKLSWKGNVPLEEKDWNVGLIVGPSGCGKSSVMRQLFGEEKHLEWKEKSIIDDFHQSHSIKDISAVCSAVGFNTVPAWLRPYHVLSNGEKFRVELARRMMEHDDPIVVDEFTSVVDRQVAKIGSHAVQKYIRRNKRKFVAVSCHHDIVEWLQPDWILEPATMKFSWRLPQPRPRLNAYIKRIPYSYWQMFAPYHYLTDRLHRAARCFGLFLDGIEHPVAFIGCLHRPHPKVRDIMGNSRTVTLPDYQGLGLSFILMEQLGAMYKAIGKRFHCYPAHPSFVRSFARQPLWKMVKKPGTFSPRVGKTSTRKTAKMGGRPCAVFRYIGPAMEKTDARRLMGK
tara:strand:+ start:8558 stop:9604 length:1047 start_codon:yes stop_codon:yes gene_type:complete